MGTLSTFPGSLDSWLESSSSPPCRAMGTGTKRDLTGSSQCCLPREQFWAPCAQMLPLLPDSTKLGYSLEALGLGWVSWAEETKKVRQNEEMTTVYMAPVYMKILLCSLWHQKAWGVRRQGYVFSARFFYKTSRNSPLVFNCIVRKNHGAKKLQATGFFLLCIFIYAEVEQIVDISLDKADIHI